MNILFYGTKKYDEEFFDAILPEYPELSIHYLEANLSPETAALASGYEAICAVSASDRIRKGSSAPAEI